jgi:hypothetical protein
LHAETQRDADDAGRKYATTAAEMLDRSGATPLLVPVPDGKAEGWDILDAVREGWSVEEIRAQLDMAEPIAAAETEARARFRFVDLHHVLNLPPVSYLVDGILTENGFSVLAGFSGSGKSFLALDFVLTIAAGVPWCGDVRVKQGPTAYIAAEGWSGFGQRARAWLGHHDVSAGESLPVFFLPAAPQMSEPDEVQELLLAIERLPARPNFIAIDALARTFGGGDENSAQDMSGFVRGVDHLRQATGAHVLTVHHTGWNTERERGNTNLRGASDTMMLVAKEDDLLTLSCLKQKEGQLFHDFHFELCTWGESAVPVAVRPEDLKKRPAVIRATRQKALDALKNADDGNGLSFTAWSEAARGLMSPATFKRAVVDLGSWGLIEKRRGKYVCT